MSPVRRPGCALSPKAGQTHAKPKPTACAGGGDACARRRRRLRIGAACLQRGRALCDVGESTRRPLYLISSVDSTDVDGTCPSELISLRMDCSVGCPDGCADGGEDG
jgi:hypothetical protein